MPVIEIDLKNIIFDPKVQNYCNNPEFKCPNYGHSWACPPEAPYLEKSIADFRKFYLVYHEFNLKDYVNKKRKDKPKQSEKRIRESFYRKEIVRDYLENEIYDFLESFKESYNEKLILWDGYCRVCNKAGESCTYDDCKPCRYPLEKRYSMEAVGIDVDKTVKNLKIQIEWPPLNKAYRFGLICFK
ncbi:MAG: DUF2284 domain-containing protein [Candidatus Heimdallarchaeota archaeon]